MVDNYCYHHYLGYYPSYGGNVLDISIDHYGYMQACMYVFMQVSVYANTLYV